MLCSQASVAHPLVDAAAKAAASSLTLSAKASQLWLDLSTVGTGAVKHRAIDGHLHVDTAAVPRRR